MYVSAWRNTCFGELSDRFDEAFGLMSFVYMGEMGDEAREREI